MTDLADCKAMGIKGSKWVRMCAQMGAVDHSSTLVSINSSSVGAAPLPKWLTLLRLKSDKDYGSEALQSNWLFFAALVAFFTLRNIKSIKFISSPKTKIEKLPLHRIIINQTGAKIIANIFLLGQSRRKRMEIAPWTGMEITLQWLRGSWLKKEALWFKKI